MPADGLYPGRIIHCTSLKIFLVAISSIQGRLETAAVLLFTHTQTEALASLRREDGRDEQAGEDGELCFQSLESHKRSPLLTVTDH